MAAGVWIGAQSSEQGGGRTVSFDRVTLTSLSLGLKGRPDRPINSDGSIVVAGLQSSRQVWPNHRPRMGVYFLLIDEELRIRPAHRFIDCGDGTRHRIENTHELRDWVFEVAEQIRAANVSQPIPVNSKPGQCRPCGAPPDGAGLHDVALYQSARIDEVCRVCRRHLSAALG
jgi:CRISPR-associated exonuclease Cas4